MKITLTGSIGYIGKPLTEKLIAQGHAVTVISSNLGRSKEILALGATPAIGKLQETDFLASTFKGLIWFIRWFHRLVISTMSWTYLGISRNLGIAVYGL